MKRKIVKNGNSLGLVIPSSIIKELNLNPGDEVDIEFDKNTKTIIITNDETASHLNHLEQVIRNAVDQYLKEKGY
jgi:antitoxin MazE